MITCQISFTFTLFCEKQPVSVYLLLLAFFPLIQTVQALDKVGHRLVSAPCLLLIVTGLFGFAFLACEEAVGKPCLLVLSSSPVRPLRVHSRLFSLTLLAFKLVRQKVISLHLADVVTGNEVIE